MEIKEFLEAEAGKPDCKLIGEDGNVFNLISIASRTLENTAYRGKQMKCANEYMTAIATTKRCASSVNM